MRLQRGAEQPASRARTVVGEPSEQAKIAGTRPKPINHRPCGAILKSTTSAASRPGSVTVSLAFGRPAMAAATPAQAPTRERHATEP